MKSDKLEQKLTAYALDELDAKAKKEVEALLEKDAEARKTVEQIREMGLMLAGHLKDEPLAELTPDQRIKLAQAMTKAASKSKDKRRSWWLLPRNYLAAAASIAVVVFAYNMMRLELKGTDEQVLNGKVISSTEVGEESPLRPAVDTKPAGKLAQGQRRAGKEGKRGGLKAKSKVSIKKRAKIDQAGKIQTFSKSKKYSALSDQLDRERRVVDNYISPAKPKAKRKSSAKGRKGIDRIGLGGLGTKGRGKGRSGLGVADLGVRSQTSFYEESAPRYNTESYSHISENEFINVADDPRSTFSIDVDTASYANLRRFISGNRQLPPVDAVRIEEMLNYFTYDYPEPKGQDPFSVTAEVASSPWKKDHRLVRIGLKGKSIPAGKRPASNLVFLLDVSGSMRSADKLPLVKRGMKLMVDQLTENDRVAIVVYASASGLVLQSTPGDQKETIISALERLQAGGSTNGGAGIQLAYQTALSNFIPGGVNRVILATDGDFNVGTTSDGALVRMIKEKAKSNVFLSVLGVGTGNYKDSKMEQLADKGNGNYAYLDSLKEARKVLVEQLGATLVTIAKDVKLQLEFNPATVAAYRLIGYENRLLAHRDFNDDKKDAGEIGAGHTVTALYEVIPAGVGKGQANVDPLKYQKQTPLSKKAKGGELLTLKLRYKEPSGKKSKLLKRVVKDDERELDRAGDDFQFASAVAAFGMLLRQSKFKGESNFGLVLELATQGKGADKGGYRAEFIRIVRQAQGLVPNAPPPVYNNPETSPPSVSTTIDETQIYVMGSLHRQIILNVILNNLSAIQYCYERQLAQNPQLAGQIIVNFVIAPNGRVKSSNVIQTSMNNAQVESCVSARIKRLIFPKPPVGLVEVKLPFNFMNK